MVPLLLPFMRFVSFELVGSVTCPTTARSHLTALVFLGDARVAGLARVPLVGEDATGGVG